MELTSGRPGKVLVRFALPIMLGELIHIVYGYTDMLIVGRSLGVDALAGIGCTVNIIMLTNGICLGLSEASGILLAQRYGAGNMRETRRIYANALLVCLCAGLLIGMLSPFLCAPLLRLLATPGDVMRHAEQYLRILLACLPVTMMNYFLSGTIRVLGDSRTPAKFQFLSACTNIALDLIAVQGLRMGVTAVACATILAQALSAVLCAMVLRKRGAVKLTREEIGVRLPCVGSVLALGVPMIFQQTIVECGNLFLQKAINSLGSAAVAAVTAAQQIREINMLFLFCLASALSTYTAQNYGAGKLGRVRQGMRSACILSAAVSVMMLAANVFLGRFAAGLLLPAAPEAVEMAHLYLIRAGEFFPMLGFMLAARSTMQGLGRKLSPSLSSASELVVAVGAAWILIPRLGFSGVTLANPLAWIFSAVPVYIAYFAWVRKAKGG